MELGPVFYRLRATVASRTVKADESSLFSCWYWFEPSWVVSLYRQTPSLAAGDMGEGVTAYREVTSAWEIARELADAGFLGAPETKTVRESCLDERVLEAAGFQTFAAFRTNREKFR